jgi:hypothetical protein
MKRFNIKKLNGMEIKEPYQVISETGLQLCKNLIKM